MLLHNLDAKNADEFVAEYILGAFLGATAKMNQVQQIAEVKGNFALANALEEAVEGYAARFHLYVAPFALEIDSEAFPPTRNQDLILENLIDYWESLPEVEN
jgi:hypothetical protein